jgi:hypothetical protein
LVIQVIYFSFCNVFVAKKLVGQVPPISSIPYM